MEALGLPAIYGMELSDLLAVLMAPVAFDPCVAVPSAQLADAAARVGVTPDQWLRCLLAAAALLSSPVIEGVDHVD